MKIEGANGNACGRALHLTYCLNAYPGESLEDQMAAAGRWARAVRRAVGSAADLLGIGLRLGIRAAREADTPGGSDLLRRRLDEESLYLFTINGFPYGAFHRQRVKEDVYRPDWRTRERLEYTCALARILAACRPPEGFGTISTVPVGFGADFRSREDVEAARRGLLAAARALAEIEERTGVHIVLALEPEPACLLETCEESLAFFESLWKTAGAERDVARRYLGVCLDTCHAAVVFERPVETWLRLTENGVPVPKIQISAALECGADPAPLAELADPVYLHQVRARCRNGERLSWLDLPDALREWPADLQIARVHYHVPLHWEGCAGLSSTRALLDQSFWARLRSRAAPHVEVETYTYDVLPPELRGNDPDDSIAREFTWVRKRLQGA